MSIQISSTSNNIVDTDTNKNIDVRYGICTQGRYTLAQAPVGIVAASLAADVTLAYLYNYVGSRTAYFKKITISFVSATAGATTLVGGAMGLQRINTLGLYPTAIPIPNRNNESYERSAIISLASAAAITMTNAVFGGEITWWRIPIFINTIDAGRADYVFQPDYPLVVPPFEGLAFRIRVALPATQTIVYSYTAEWCEK